jgi:isochorismate synthase
VAVSLTRHPPRRREPKSACSRLHEEARSIWDIRAISALLTWDQHTVMPSAGAAVRAAQLAFAERVTYDRYASTAVAEAIAELARSAPEENSFAGALLRVMRHEHLKARRVPPELREQLAKASGTAQLAWAQARRSSDFSQFQPHLQRNIELRRRYADCFPHLDDPYDAHLDDFDPGLTSAELLPVVSALKRKLLPLARRLRGVEAEPALPGPFEVDRQRVLVGELVSRAGLDLGRARVHESEHPLTIAMGRGDVGMTTRFAAENLDGVFLALHELGHAHYEQGFDVSLERTPLAQGASASVHESQARLYENLLGRSAAFSRYLFERLRIAFPAAFAETSFTQFHRVVNGVRNSPIRLQADELTYPLHIILRLELERSLLSGELSVGELPDAWTGLVAEYLGLDVPDDASGVLQDPHWAFGGFGYFPTYLLGNIVAVQLWNEILRASPGIANDLESGCFDAINRWLREHVWRHGRSLTVSELLGRAVGTGLDPEPFAAYLERKFVPMRVQSNGTGPRIAEAASANGAVSPRRQADKTPVRATMRPTELLDRYRRESFFFASPSRTLLAEGRVWSSQGAAHPSPTDLVMSVARALEAGDGAGLVVGAVPFSPGGEPRLVIPTRVHRAAPLEADIPVPERLAPSGDWDVTQIPDPDAYVRGVECALDELRAGRLEKIVLARALELRTTASIDARQLLRNLAWRDPGGYTFAVDLRADNHDGPASSLIGASPELLVSRAGARVVANPLAGSAARSLDPAIDRERALALLNSAKNRHEHALAVDHVAESLRPFCTEIARSPTPSLVRTATMWHLSTRIVGDLAQPAASSLQLAMALHPTPVVCGVPVDAARETIQRIEPFDRGLYAGIVGWCDEAGDGEWAVAIRCSVIDEHSVRLFAGAGIVEESNPLEELEETSAKCRTLLSALGVSQEI